MAEDIVNVDQAEFEQEVLAAEKPVVVDFWAPWCGPCKMLAPVLEDIAAENSDQLKVVKVNIDNNQSLAKKYGIQSIPYLGFFKDGEVVDQMVGFSNKEAIVQKVQAL